MRMVRGSNLYGYSGFKKVVEMEDYKIVRPLIHYTKEQLEEIAYLTNAKVFDGRTDLLKAFKDVRGYN